MLRITLISLISIFLFASMACDQESETIHEFTTFSGVEQSVLVFSKTAGFRHDSIEAGAEAVKNLGQDNGFNVTWTEESGYFTPENLSNYDAIIFLNTTLNVFENDDQRNAFQGYIQNGGGFVGVHSATDTEYDWPWYGELVGAYFDNHPPGVIPAAIDVVDHDHPSTAHLPERWERTDEWYNFGFIYDELNVLMKLDTDSYEGSDHPGNHPISWYHEYDGGRSFYTASGHTIESFSEPEFLTHLLGGIQYAMGITD